MLKGSQSMKFRNTYIVVALAASVLTLPVSTDAAGPQVRARFSFDGLANCENPPVRNFPIHGEGTGVLSVDRSATMDVSSNVGGGSSTKRGWAALRQLRPPDLPRSTSWAGTRFVPSGIIQTTSLSSI